MLTYSFCSCVIAVCVSKSVLPMIPLVGFLYGGKKSPVRDRVKEIKPDFMAHSR